MNKNMSRADKMIRYISAVIVAFLVYFKEVEGTLSYILIAAASIFVITSLVNFCLSHSLFGLNTCPVKDKKYEEK